MMPKTDLTQINLRVPRDRLASIDAKAARAGVDRTTYMIEMADSPTEAALRAELEAIRKLARRLVTRTNKILGSRKRRVRAKT